MVAVSLILQLEEGDILGKTTSFQSSLLLLINVFSILTLSFQ